MAVLGVQRVSRSSRSDARLANSYNHRIGKFPALLVDLAKLKANLESQSCSESSDINRIIIVIMFWVSIALRAYIRTVFKSGIYTFSYRFKFR